MSAGPLLEVSNLGKRYGGLVALEGLSLTLASGSLTGIVRGNDADGNVPRRNVILKPLQNSPPFDVR